MKIQISSNMFKHTMQTTTNLARTILLKNDYMLSNSDSQPGSVTQHMWFSQQC